ncbi:MAG: hypothetical protein HFJ09_16490 [Lachnospiraceae bacterium]|nr:hypothetical protein [Lachnospiraceae bacterium]
MDKVKEYFQIRKDLAIFEVSAMQKISLILIVILFIQEKSVNGYFSVLFAGAFAGSYHQYKKDRQKLDLVAMISSAVIVISNLVLAIIG